MKFTRSKAVILIRNIVSLFVVFLLTLSLFSPIAVLKFENSSVPLVKITEEYTRLVKRVTNNEIPLEAVQQPQSAEFGAVSAAKATYLFIQYKFHDMFAEGATQKNITFVSADSNSGAIGLLSYVCAAADTNVIAALAVFGVFLLLLILPIVAILILLISLIRFFTHLKWQAEYRDEIIGRVSYVSCLPAAFVFLPLFVHGAELSSFAILTLGVFAVWSVLAAVLIWLDRPGRISVRYVLFSQILSVIGLGAFILFTMKFISMDVFGMITERVVSEKGTELQLFVMPVLSEGGQEVIYEHEVWFGLLMSLIVTGLGMLVGVYAARSIARMNCRGEQDANDEIKDSLWIYALLTLLLACSCLLLPVFFSENGFTVAELFNGEKSSDYLTALIAVGIMVLTELVWIPVRKKCIAGHGRKNQHASVMNNDNDLGNLLDERPKNTGVEVPIFDPEQIERDAKRAQEAAKKEEAAKREAAEREEAANRATAVPEQEEPKNADLQTTVQMTDDGDPFISGFAPYSRDTNVEKGPVTLRIEAEKAEQAAKEAQERARIALEEAAKAARAAELAESARIAKENATAAANVVNTVSEKTESALEDVWDKTAETFASEVQDTADEVREQAAEAVTEAKEEAAEAVAEVREQAEETVTEAKEEIAETVAEVQEQVEETVTEAKEEIAETVAEVQEQVEETVTEAKEEIAEAVAEVQEQAAEAVTEVKEEAAEAVTEAKEEAAEAVVTAEEKAAEAEAEVKEKVAEADLDFWDSPYVSHGKKN